MPAATLGVARRAGKLEQAGRLSCQPGHALQSGEGLGPFPGAWIFVSHSLRDLEKVRRIRNELERRGRNPLLFFLKCLEADDARPPELIRDESKASTFFVLCNTRAS